MCMSADWSPDTWFAQFVETPVIEDLCSGRKLYCIHEMLDPNIQFWNHCVKKHPKKKERYANFTDQSEMNFDFMK